jgi:hypothetical protein
MIRPVILGCLAALGCVFAASTLQAQSEEGKALAEFTAANYPVVMRDRVSTHYRLPDGSMRAVFTVNPHNYRDADGNWRPIAETISAGSDYAFENLQNGLTSRYPFALEDGVVFQGIGFPQLVMRPRALAAYDAEGGVLESLAPQAAFAYAANDSTVHYAGLFPGATDEYIVGPDRVKHNLKLQRHALDRFEGAAYIGGEFTLNVPAGYSVVPVPESGAVRLYNTAGECVYEIGRVVAYDSAEERFVGELITRLEGSKLVTTMRVSAEWMFAPQRQWPVRIDPTLTLQPDATTGNDAYVRSDLPSNNFGTDRALTANLTSSRMDTTESFISFDLSSIAGTTVNAARMELYHAFSDVTGDRWSLTNVLATWDSGTVTWNNRPSIATTSETALDYGPGTGVWRLFQDLEDITQEWVDGTTNNYGLRIKNESNVAGVATHPSSNHSVPSESPRYIVDYDNIDPPSVNTVTPANVEWGQQLTINGTDLGAVTDVTLGGVAQTIDSTSDTVIEVTVVDTTPTGLQTLAVTNAAGTDDTMNVTVVGVAPELTSASPDPVQWGEDLTVTGDFFSSVSEVLIGGESLTFTVIDANTLDIEVSTATPTGNQTIAVTNSIGTTDTLSVTVEGIAPSIHNVSPDPVAWGAVLTIDGAFLSNATVTIGGENQTLDTNTDAQITLTLSSATPVGQQTITVTTAHGDDNQDVVVSGVAPVVTGVNPDPVQWFATLTITGTELGNASVTIGGVSQTITGNTGTSVEVSVDGATPTGTQTVAVTTPGGTDDNMSVEVLPLAPVVTSVSPDPVTWAQPSPSAALLRPSAVQPPPRSKLPSATIHRLALRMSRSLPRAGQTTASLLPSTPSRLPLRRSTQHPLCGTKPLPCRAPGLATSPTRPWTACP